MNASDVELLASVAAIVLTGVFVALFSRQIKQSIIKSALVFAFLAALIITVFMVVLGTFSPGRLALFTLSGVIAGIIIHLMIRWFGFPNDDLEL